MGFTRNIEDFTCTRCGTDVVGDGYTNHCPVCLYSRHVDNAPGDRANPCRGPMRPIGVDRKAGRIVLIHRCERCGEERRCRAADDDDTDAIIRVSSSPDLPI